MLIGGILLGLILGLLAGGSLLNLSTIRLKHIPLLLAALVLRFGTELLLQAHVAPVEFLRIPLYALSFGLLLYALWVNRGYPGLSLAFVGILANAVVILVNGGYMPVWEPSLTAAGFTTADVSLAIHTILPPPLDASFLLHLGPLADVIPIPLPIVQNVASIGDIFLSAGLAFFLFASVVRVPQELDEAQLAIIRRRLEDVATPRRQRRVSDELAMGGDTGLSPALTSAIALDRPLILGGAVGGMASPAATPLASPDLAAANVAATATAAAAATAATDADLSAAGQAAVITRVRQHPYIRLALNGSFSALWTGQLISLFGDRLNQLALVAVVFYSTGSTLASGLAFFSAMLPNLLLSPIAGTFVDRWDHKETMVVSDILRAGLVLLLPVAAVVNILLVYPLIFLVTSVSVFFRPARVAILPRIVPEEDLLSANSALWVGETIADVFGVALAALFVTTLGTAVPLAFWVDSATYLASAALVSTIVIVASNRSEEEHEASEGFFAELRAGWQFLRQETVLFTNTLQGAVAQFAVGISIALTAAYARHAFSGTGVGYLTAYGFIEAGIGVGNLIGGFLIGLIGVRFAKGRMIIVGYTALGVTLFLFGMTNNLPLAIGLAFGGGVANMIYVIPSQTLFQERTPPELMGRVVGFRFALVFGSMTFALALGSVLGELVGPGPVIAVFGLVTAVAGLAGLLIPAVRDA